MNTGIACACIRNFSREGQITNTLLIIFYTPGICMGTERRRV